MSEIERRHLAALVRMAVLVRALHGDGVPSELILALTLEALKGPDGTDDRPTKGDAL